MIESRLDPVYDKPLAKILTLPPLHTEDKIKKPEHYARWKVEPIRDFVMINKVPFAVGCVVKYVMRYDAKDGLQDLLKARRYIDMIIEQEYPEYAKNNSST